MNILFTRNAWTHYQEWQQLDKRIVKQINRLIKECQRDPFSGIGKPEPLKHQLSGCWSRRIDHVNRMVYTVSDDQLQIIALKGHY